MVNARIYNEDNLDFLTRTRRKYQLIYLDPPYGTGNDWDSYDDSRTDRENWLEYWKPRFEFCKKRLANNGTLWIQLDDHMSHYCKVLLDGIFGSKKFVANVVWRRKDRITNNSNVSPTIDHILCYGDADSFNNLPYQKETIERDYCHKDENGRYKKEATHAPSGDGYDYDLGMGEKKHSGGYRMPKETAERWIKEGRLIVEEGKVPTKKNYLKDMSGMTPRTDWVNIAQNSTATSELKTRFGSKIFDTPKPLGLLQKIIHISTNKGDNVLDCVAGSGTTGEAAVRMERNVDLVELKPENCELIEKRLKMVSDLDPNEDKVDERLDWEEVDQMSLTKYEVEYTEGFESDLVKHFPGLHKFDQELGEGSIIETNKKIVVIFDGDTQKVLDLAMTKDKPIEVIETEENMFNVVNTDLDIEVVR